jgi:cytochrome c5
MEGLLSGMIPRQTWFMAVPASAIALLYAAGAFAQEPRNGEQIMNASCGTCHDTWVMQTAAKSESDWVQTVDNMIARGATVSDEEWPVLIQYLVRYHGPVPDGPGKSVLLNVCTQCHDLNRVKQTRHTSDEWEEILVTMLNEGAPLADADFPVVLAYLAKNFGVE